MSSKPKFITNFEIRIGYRGFKFSGEPAKQKSYPSLYIIPAQTTLKWAKKLHAIKNSCQILKLELAYHASKFSKLLRRVSKVLKFAK